MATEIYCGLISEYPAGAAEYPGPYNLTKVFGLVDSAGDSIIFVGAPERDI